MVIIRAIYSLILIAGGILCLATDYFQTQGISLFFIFALFVVRGGYELNKLRRGKLVDVWEEILYTHRSKSLIFYYLFHIIFIVVGLVSMNINYQAQLSLSGFLIGLSFITFGLLGLTDIYRYVQSGEAIEEETNPENTEEEVERNTNSEDNVIDFLEAKRARIQDEKHNKEKHIPK